MKIIYSLILIAYMPVYLNAQRKYYVSGRIPKDSLLTKFELLLIEKDKGFILSEMLFEKEPGSSDFSFHSQNLYFGDYELRNDSIVLRTVSPEIVSVYKLSDSEIIYIKESISIPLIRMKQHAGRKLFRLYRRSRRFK